MIKEFEVANLLLGKSKSEAEKTLKDKGYTFVGTEEGYYEYERKVGDIEYELVFRLGSKSKVFYAEVDFEPEAAGTFLTDMTKFKEVVTTFGKSLKISTGENCDFQLFQNSAGETAKLDYETMLSRIDSSTNGYKCLWAADALTLNADQVILQLISGELTAVYFECDNSDYYMSYDATIAVASNKYK